MKTKSIFPLVAIVAIVAVAAICFATPAREKGLVVHEWGTFTALQGGDGELIYWRPLQSSQLPDFVHAWNKPGVGLAPVLGLNKAGMVAMQRLETPVIYFYADEKSAAKSVDVSVRFPMGRITEWYPQATSVGPTFGLASRLMNAYTNIGYIEWSGLSLMAPEKKLQLPSDASGSHYFAARDTDADYVRCNSKATNEFDKFLFYRGVGNFTTPLRVTMKSEDSVTLINAGKEPLKDLFILNTKEKSGNFIYVAELKPGEERTISIGSKMVSAPEMTKNISHDMAQALRKSGLYQREAAAMVNTWKDSWFAEDGLRVLYILPRHWTDQTLPMTINPAPGELVRVMVGRAEILLPSVEHSLTLDLDKAKQGDAAASNEARKTLRSLGRFAEPAFARALASANAQPEEQARLVALLHDANKTD
jgi:hypothetical protein